MKSILFPTISFLTRKVVLVAAGSVVVALGCSKQNEASNQLPNQITSLAPNSITTSHLQIACEGQTSYSEQKNNKKLKKTHLERINYEADWQPITVRLYDNPTDSIGKEKTVHNWVIKVEGEESFSNQDFRDAKNMRLVLSTVKVSDDLIRLSKFIEKYPLNIQSNFSWTRDNNRTFEYSEFDIVTINRSTGKWSRDYQKNWPKLDMWIHEETIGLCKFE